MSKTVLTYAAVVAVIALVSVPVHYLAGLDWPWAIVAGAVVSIVARWLIDSGVARRVGKPPLPGGR